MPRAANGEAGGARHRDLRGPGAHQHRRSRPCQHGHRPDRPARLPDRDGRDVDGAAAGQDTDVQTVVIDPHSSGATLIKPLTDAEVAVTQPSTSDPAVAHSTFLDEPAAGPVASRRAGRARRGRPPRHTKAAGRRHGVVAARHARGRVAVAAHCGNLGRLWTALRTRTDYDLLASVY
jgi:hypothetical protein